MRNYEERAKDFIQQVFSYLEGCEDVWDFRSAIQRFNEDYRRNVSVKNGIARVALITSDYVVKFNYDSDCVEDVGGCEEEIRLYADAEREGFAYLLAKITRYDYEGVSFYIMPRVRGFRNRWMNAEYFMTHAERVWCETHHLYDLHCGNYGFRNGHVCLVDYACCTYRVNASS